MEEIIIWAVIAALVLLVILPFVLRTAIPGLYAAIAVFAYTLFVGLDVAFGAAIIPGAPWLMWAFWGAAIGAALGFWTIAPVYGLRGHRPLIAALPFAAMLLVFMLRVAVQRGL